MHNIGYFFIGMLVPAITIYLISKTLRLKKAEQILSDIENDLQFCSTLFPNDDLMERVENYFK